MQVLRKQDWFHPDGFPIVVERRDPQEPFGLHSHEFSELVIIVGGRGVHQTDDDAYELAPGDTFVISGSRRHDYRNMDQLQLVNILFDAQDRWLGGGTLPVGDLGSLAGYHALFTLEPAWRKRHLFNSRLQLSPAELAEALRMVESMESELSVRGPGFGVMASTTLLQLMTFLSRCYGRTGNPQSKRLLRIAEAISHIERHSADPITLDQLVEISGMSRRNFLRAFSSTMGDTPMNYVIRLRIRNACRLLQETDWSITRIAGEVGFQDSNYFSRKFRSLLDVTPREYRNRRTQ